VLLGCGEQTPQATTSPGTESRKSIWSGLTAETNNGAEASEVKGPLDLLLRELDTQSDSTREGRGVEPFQNDELSSDTTKAVDSKATSSLKLSEPAVSPENDGSRPAQQILPTVADPRVSEDNSEDLTINGEMHIDFGSRLIKDGTDIYSLDLTCADSIRVKGKILREASVVGSIIDRERKLLEFQYYLELSLAGLSNPSREQPAGKIKGSILRLADGTYNADGLMLEAPLTFLDAPLSGVFSGKLLGREEGKKIGGAKYTRRVGKEFAKLNVRNIAPIEFEGMVLGGGPLNLYPETKVAGSFDYDYDSGNWLTAGITFDHEGSEPDKMTGSIKWIADPDREHNGKGQYEFNLRFNEDLYSARANWASAVDLVGDEKAFFMVDTQIPTLHGEIKFRDSLRGNDEHGQPLVTKSDIQYALIGSKLTKQQLFNFLKMWLIMVGPVNDL